jgi:hypothetical protein
MPRRECRYLRLVFGLEDRAGCVEQQAALREAAPQRIQNARLLRDEIRDIRFAAQPFDVGVAAHDPGRRAWDVGEDPVERAPAPPWRDIAASPA